MRAILAALLLSTVTACALHRVEPAAGAALSYEYCETTTTGVRVFRRETRCPDIARVNERIERAERRYDVSLSGARLYVTGAAELECGGRGAFGCTVAPDTMTVTAGLGLYAVIEHEARHVAINRTGGAGDIRHWTLDHPEAGNEPPRRMSDGR